MLEKLEGKGLIIHHWDTDGICCTKLILEKLKDKQIKNVIPTIGNYFLTDEELEQFSKYDYIIILDMSLPTDNLLYLAKRSKIMIFDHHLGNLIDNIFHYNPIIKGENPDFYPSASWIVNDYLKNKVNLYALLGIVGDHELKIKNNFDFNKKIDDFCIENNLTFEDLLKMVYLLDSNYKIGDKKAVEEAPYELLKIKNAQDILKNKKWDKNLKKLEDEINKILKTK